MPTTAWFELTGPPSPGEGSRQESLEVEELAFGFDCDFDLDFDLDSEEVLVDVSDFSDGFGPPEDLFPVA